jgi:hypothetical protein
MELPLSTFFQFPGFGSTRKQDLKAYLLNSDIEIQSTAACAMNALNVNLIYKRKLTSGSENESRIK